MYTLAGCGDTENFVGNNLSNGKAIVHLGALQVARREISHAESFLGRFTRDRKRWRILFVQRQIIGGMTVTEQSGGFAPVAAVLVKIPSGNENNRCRAIRYLGTIGYFKRRLVT